MKETENTVGTPRIRSLSIGNSFSQDALVYARAIAAADDIGLIRQLKELVYGYFHSREATYLKQGV